MTNAAALFAAVADALTDPLFSVLDRCELWAGPELAINRIHIPDLFDVSRKSKRINIGGGVGLCYRVVFVIVCFHCFPFVVVLCFFVVESLLVVAVESVVFLCV